MGRGFSWLPKMHSDLHAHFQKILPDKFISPERQGRGGPGARKGEEVEGRLDLLPVPDAAPLLASVPGEQELAEQAGALLRPLAHTRVPYLHPGQLPLDQEVDVRQVDGVMILRQLGGQRLEIIFVP